MNHRKWLELIGHVVHILVKLVHGPPVKEEKGRRAGENEKDEEERKGEASIINYL